jgi:hypothetical protein
MLAADGLSVVGLGATALVAATVAALDLIVCGAGVTADPAAIATTLRFSN